MGTWLQHPGFQSAAVPFLVALVLGAALARTRLGAVAVFAGVLACVHLAIGLDLFPLNATRRILALTGAALALGLLVDRLPMLSRLAPGAAAALGALAALWVTHTALGNLGGTEAVGLGVAVAGCGAAIALGFDRLSARPIAASCASLGAGLGVGAAALLSASASLGQIGLALGAASGALVLVQMMRGTTTSTGRGLTLPAALLAGSIGAAAVLLARAPWYALPILAAVPFASASLTVERLPVWLRAIVHGALSLAVAALAAALAWHAAGDGSSGY